MRKKLIKTSRISITGRDLNQRIVFVQFFCSVPTAAIEDTPPRGGTSRIPVSMGAGVVCPDSGSVAELSAEI